MSKTYQFPKDFVWGTATSSYQTEGNNKNTDWWEWETKSLDNQQQKKPRYPMEKSGIACDSYNRYEEDFDLCVKLNNNAVRISLEWARIEPTAGVFDETELDHYRKVLQAARTRGLKTFVTLHHFTLPLWLAKKGGWAKLGTPKIFEMYAKVCAEKLGDLIDVILTINEPEVYMLEGYIGGVWPPNKTNPFLALLVQQNLIKAHKLAYSAIKKVNPKYHVGIVKNISWFYSDGKFDLIGKLFSKIMFFLNSHAFLWQVKRHMDVIGLNYYLTNKMVGPLLRNTNDVVSDLGWWIAPFGLEKVLLSLKKYNLPIYITENGVADEQDKLRPNFITDMLISCHNAMAQNVPLKGYFYWSLIDNFEWHQGYWPKFGLVNIDRDNNLARIPRESFYYYSQICRDGKLFK